MIFTRVHFSKEPPPLQLVKVPLPFLSLKRFQTPIGRSILLLDPQDAGRCSALDLGLLVQKPLVDLPYLETLRVNLTIPFASGERELRSLSNPSLF